MSNINITPNMNLPVPVTGLEPGPDWANDYNNCMNLLDTHSHSPGSGVPVTSSGLSINADLPFNINNATTLRSARFSAQASPLSLGSDIGCVYVSGVDLYYNDISGNQVRITQSGSVAGSTGTITGLPSGTASAAYASGSGTFQFLQATSTAANIDAATYVLRYPGSYPTPSGNFVALQASTSLASGYSLTFPAAGPISGGNLLGCDAAGIMAYFGTDNISLQTSGTTLSIKDGGVTPTKLSAAVFGVSSSSGTFSTSNGSYTAVTNLSVTLTVTGGRPVIAALFSDGNGSDNPAEIITDVGSIAQLRITRGATPLATYGITYQNAITPQAIDQNPPGGSLTYAVSVKKGSSSSIAVNYYVLVVYQL